MLAGALAAAFPSVAPAQTQHAQHSRARAALLAEAPARMIYQCPMDKDVVSDKAGKCPKCGMKLVKKEMAAASSKKMRCCPEGECKGKSGACKEMAAKGSPKEKAGKGSCQEMAGADSCKESAGAAGCLKDAAEHQ
jgi:hypothetical protein